MFVMLLLICLTVIAGSYFQMDPFSFAAASFLAVIVGYFVESMLQGTALQPRLIRSTTSKYLPVNDAYYLMEGQQITAIFGFVILAKPQDMSPLSQLSNFEFEINISSLYTSFLLYIKEDYPNIMRKIPFNFISNAESKSKDFKKALVKLMPGLQLERMPISNLSELLGLPEYTTDSFSMVDNSDKQILYEEILELIKRRKKTIKALNPLFYHLNSLKGYFTRQGKLETMLLIAKFVKKEPELVNLKNRKKIAKILLTANQETALLSNFSVILHQFKRILSGITIME